MCSTSMLYSHTYTLMILSFTTAANHDTSPLCRRLSNCAADINSWSQSRHLQRNASKTEIIWFGSRSNLLKLRNTDSSLQVGSSQIQPSTVVRDLGLHLDSELSMSQHIAKVAATCFYHLRRLRQIRRRVGTEVTIRLVLAVVMSRVDYCNSTLAGLPQSTLAPLQRVQNAAARLVFELGSREHVTPCLLQLHWLPVRWRIQFKLCCMMHAVCYGNIPVYLANIVHPTNAGRFRRRLRSASSSDYTLQCHDFVLNLAGRAFSHAGPAAWNALPEDIRSNCDRVAFRKQRKTHFFGLAFNVR